MVSEPKRRIAAVGAGRMGRGIAHVFAYAGHPVTIVDLKDRSVEDAERLGRAAKAEIAGDLGFLASLGVLTDAQVSEALSLIDVAAAGDAAAALAEADVIFEGVPEVLEIKEAALGRMSRLARPEAVIASTTSTMLVTQLAGFVDGPERFLNAHWLNPAYLIPLVEVSPGPATSEAVTAGLIALLDSVGKVPVRCAATPGYIIPRLQSLMLSEAARMVHEGVASPEDIDKAITVGFGPRYSTMGAVEFIDWGGVDIVYYAGNYLAKVLESPGHKPPPEIERMMADGHKGLREGRGYYDFTKIDVDAYRKDKLTRLVQMMRYLDLLPGPGVAGR